MSGADLKDVLDDRARGLPRTVDRYHRMIGGGIIEEGEPYELLNEWVVRRTAARRGKTRSPWGIGTRGR
jgi:hypothetical protein